MTEATDSVHLTQLRTRLHCATNTRARQVAMNLAKRQLQAQGFRLSQFSHREIVLRAELYLADHRAELIADARWWSNVGVWKGSLDEPAKAAHGLCDGFLIRRNDLAQILRSMRAESAVEPTRSDNITVTWRRSAVSWGFGSVAVAGSSGARAAPATTDPNSTTCDLDHVGHCEAVAGFQTAG